jgi:simple sugar transport system permease protein
LRHWRRRALAESRPWAAAIPPPTRLSDREGATSETTAPGAPADERLVRVGVLSRLLTRPDIGALLGAIAVFFAFAYFARAVDWLSDPGIAAGWTDQAAQYGIVAVPVALLMIGGEFDLSAGVMIGSSGLLLGYLTTFQNMNVWPAIVLVLLFGLAIGLINGITVVRTKLPSFIVTLATFFVLQGVNAAGTLKLTGQTAIQNIDSASGYESAQKLFAGGLSHYDFKVKVLWWIGITALGAWLLAKSRFGNWIYSAGGDPGSARNVGVPVARTKIALFMMTSVTASLMGIIEALELRSMQSGEGIGLEFIFIICAVVGGCLLTGGFGSVIGTFFGAAMLGMVQLGIVDSQWDSNWTFTFQGAILFAAVLLNTMIRGRAQRAR